VSEEASQEAQAQVADLLARRTGLAFTGASRWRLSRAIAETGLWADEQEFQRLCDAVTVQESYFYREPARLEAIRDRILAPARSRAGRLRVWSAGCAAGEEAYTLAAMCHEVGLRGRFEILGTDLSRGAVDAALEGCYTRWSLRGLEPSQISGMFEPAGTRYRIADRYRDNVWFEQHNLLEPIAAARGRFDLVVCRNVLIYFTPDAAQAAVHTLAEALVPRGWLALGASDPLMDQVPQLEPVATPAGLLYRKRGKDSSAERSLVRRPADRARSAGATSPDRGRSPAGLSRPSRTAAQHDRTHSQAHTAHHVSALLAASERALDLADAEKAERTAREVLADAPEHGAAHLLLARSLTEQGRADEAHEVVQGAILLRPEDPDIHLMQAVVHLERGDAVAAAEAARRAIYLAPSLGAAFPVLARARELLGDALGAERARRRGRRLLETRGR
jgi:chemotaxis protein methyltransferase CheR